MLPQDSRPSQPALALPVARAVTLAPVFAVLRICSIALRKSHDGPLQSRFLMTLTRRPTAWEGGLTPQMDIMSTTTTTSIATTITPIIVTTMASGPGPTHGPLG